MEKLITKLGITLDEVAYMGDDINDLGVMRMVKIAAAPKNSAAEVLERVHFISTKDGGDGAVREFIEDGAVRELIEFLIKENGTWENLINRFLNQK